MGERAARLEVADVIQIGSRSMQNFPLLTEVGRAGKPVLLKRGFGATLEEWVYAAEYVALGGCLEIIFCERGIRTFANGAYDRATLDVAAVHALRKLTPFPVIVDPSHGTGSRPDVLPMALAAVAAGADGVMVEVHPHPETAFSDGPQSLTPPAFADLVGRLRRVAEAVDRSL